VAAEALRSFEATQGRRQAGAAVENLQELLRALEPALATGAPVDRAKVFFRLKTELAEGAAALLGVEVGLARDAEGVAGQRTALRLSLNHRGDTALEDIRVSVLSPWPARAGQSAVSGAPTRLEPGASADCEVALPVPEVPARSLLPFVVEVRGQAAGSPFTLAALVDVTVQPALTAGLDVGRLRVGSSRPVPVWLTNRTGGAAQGTIALEVPAEWRIEPALQKFEIPAGATRPIRFVVSLSKNAPTGPASLRADIRTVAPETQRLQPLSLSVGEAAPRIVVRRVAEPPALDGALTEVVWRGPPSIPELIHFRLDQPASEKTAVWLTYDERGLYVAFRCQESNMNAIKATLTERGSPLYEDDDVELFIAAPGRAALQFAINSLGTQSDNFGNNTPWRAAARRGEDEWSVEVFIPFAGLGLEGPPIPSDVWDMQIGRQEKRLGERTAWTRCPDGFRTEAHFGEVEFGE
jgi:hypothetical protein